MNGDTLVQRTKTAFSGYMRRQRENRVDKSMRKRILELYWHENMGLRKIAELLEVSHTTVWRVVNENEPPKSVRDALKRFGPLLAGS